jgi:hypothetical protein
MQYKIYYVSSTKRAPLASVDAKTPAAAIKQYRDSKPYPVSDPLIAVIVLH